MKREDWTPRWYRGEANLLGIRVIRVQSFSSSKVKNYT